MSTPVSAASKAAVLLLAHTASWQSHTLRALIP